MHTTSCRRGCQERARAHVGIVDDREKILPGLIGDNIDFPAVLPQLEMLPNR